MTHRNCQYILSNVTTPTLSMKSTRAGAATRYNKKNLMDSCYSCLGYRFCWHKGVSLFLILENMLNMLAESQSSDVKPETTVFGVCVCVLDERPESACLNDRQSLTSRLACSWKPQICDCECRKTKLLQEAMPAMVTTTRVNYQV